MTVSVKVKGLEIQPEVDETRNERNKVRELETNQENREQERFRKILIQRPNIYDCNNVIHLVIITYWVKKLI